MLRALPRQKQTPRGLSAGRRNEAGTGFGEFGPGGPGHRPGQPRLNERGRFGSSGLLFLTNTVYHKSHKETKDILRKFC